MPAAPVYSHTKKGKLPMLNPKISLLSNTLVVNLWSIICMQKGKLTQWLSSSFKDWFRQIYIRYLFLESSSIQTQYILLWYCLSLAMLLLVLTVAYEPPKAAKERPSVHRTMERHLNLNNLTHLPKKEIIKWVLLHRCNAVGYAVSRVWHPCVSAT